jgi:hypothetical protein
MKTLSFFRGILLLLTTTFLTCPAISQEIIDVRGSFKVGNKWVKQGYKGRFNFSDEIQFSSNSDVLIVVAPHKPGEKREGLGEFLYTVVPQSYDLRSNGSPCTGNCAPKWYCTGVAGAVDSPTNGSVPEDIKQYFESRRASDFASSSLPTPTETRKNQLFAGESLYPGQFLTCDNNAYKLIYQTDGNLVLYRLSDNLPLWCSRTDGKPAGRCTMQTNGNLVIYTPNNGAIWATGTWTDKYRGGELFLSANGNLTIESGQGAVWWESRTFESSANNTMNAGYRRDIYPAIWPTVNRNYRIKSAVGDVVLDVWGNNSSAGTSICVHSAHGGNNQNWVLSRSSAGFYFIKSALGRHLDLQNGSPAPGTPVQLWDFNGSYAQKWDIMPAGDGWYYLRSPTGMYLDVQNGSAANGTKVWTQRFNGSAAQKWRFE